jgi:hypothetical protein
LSSPSFAGGCPIPRRHAGKGVGDDISPALAWSGVPGETAEILLLIDDPDAPLPRPFVHWWKLERPLTPIAAQMNLGYALAAAIIDGEALVQQFSPQRINQDDVWALIPRITAHHDADCDRAGPLSRGRTRLRVEFCDGEVLERERQASRAILQPQSNDLIVAKYRHLSDGLIDEQRQAEIERAVLSLERLPDAKKLTELLFPTVCAAFGDVET